MDTKIFINYLYEKGFPDKKYNAIYDYPNTKKINGKPFNYFTQNYKRKFLNDVDVKTILNTNEKKNKLFQDSIPIISQFQKNILKNKMESYITGGSALKLYSIINKEENHQHNSLLTTADFDMYLCINTIIMDNNVIIHKLPILIESIYETIPNPNYMFLDIYLLLNFENMNNIDYVLDFFLNNNYDLYKFNPFSEKNNYYFKFIKIINKEFCIKITIKFDVFSLNLSKYRKKGILIINNYYYDHTKNFKLVYNFVPIELVIIKKKEENIKLLRSKIEIKNNQLFIFNEKTILYNLFNLFYKYQCLKEDKSIQNKIKSGKNKRDFQRLEYFFNYYCKHFYPNFNEKDKHEILEKIKSQKQKFSNSVIVVKNFSKINNYFL